MNRNGFLCIIIFSLILKNRDHSGYDLDERTEIYRPSEYVIHISKLYAI